MSHTMGYFVSVSFNFISIFITYSDFHSAKREIHIAIVSYTICHSSQAEHEAHFPLWASRAGGGEGSSLSFVYFWDS